jgi:hypothetical protein
VKIRCPPTLAQRPMPNDWWRTQNITQRSDSARLHAT